MYFYSKKALLIAFLGLSIVTSFSIGFHEAQAQGVTDERRAQLEKELAALEAEIAVQKNIVNTEKTKRVSLERDVAILDANIKKSQLQIKALDIAIAKLSNDITTKEQVIGTLSERIAREKESLARLIVKRREMDDTTLPEVVFGNQELSGFFSDIDSFDSVNEALRNSFKQIQTTKQNTENQRDVLLDRKAEETRLRGLQKLEADKIVVQKAEKNRILTTTKGNESAYTKVLKDKEKNAAQIRSALFELQGTAAIPFGKALEYANLVSAKTGVRPAFILGIIAEESNLGENVGTGNWKTDMHPDRDAPIFLQITTKLGVDPDKMPVSKKPWYGWGGAMGPAQFIPSTWVLYEAKVTALTGNSPANPWNPYDAFMASALLLKDNGAAAGTAAAERLAALRYLAGWKNATKPEYAFYGDDVMELAEKYQRNIDILKGV